MKLRYTLIMLCVLAAGSTMAQTFAWTTNDTIEATLTPNTVSVLRMDQEALNGDTIVLGIEVVHNDIPQGMDGMVCIQGTCFGQIPIVGFTGQMSPIGGATPGWVRLTINPMNETGQAKLRIRIYDVANPQYSDTATWLLNVGPVASLDEQLFDQGVEIFPNPVVNELNVSSESTIDRIDIVDLSGKLVFNRKVGQNGLMNFDISALNPGSYRIILFDEKGNRVVRQIQKF